jgi:hypothetical protein
VYRDVARAESIKELILKNVAPYNPDNFLNVVQYEDSGHDVIVCLSDLHAGAGIDSAWNKFNKDILKARLESYAAQVFNIVARHAAEKIHVLLLGDLKECYCIVCGEQYHSEKPNASRYCKGCAAKKEQARLAKIKRKRSECTK